LIRQRAHENLHYIQDTSSRWDKLETFFGGKTIDFDRLSRDEAFRILDFARQAYGRATTLREAVTLLRSEAAVYNSIKPTLQLLRKVQVYLSIEQYTKEELEKRLQHPTYRQFLGNVDPQVYAKVFESTSELAVLLDPIEAARFVGRYGDFLQIYQREVERLKREKGIDNIQLEIKQRRLKYLEDIKKIADEAKIYVQQKYEAHEKSLKGVIEAPHPPSQ
jgi:hypothetical protein